MSSGRMQSVGGGPQLVAGRVALAAELRARTSSMMSEILAVL